MTDMLNAYQQDRLKAQYAKLKSVLASIGSRAASERPVDV